MLIDIGVNLTSTRFQHDMEKVIKHASEQGVTKMLVTGTSVHESQAASSLARLYPGQLYATAGIHPHHADDYSDAAKAQVAALLACPEVVAVGECGLDFNRNFSTAENQRHCFEQLLQLAVEVKLPVFLHQRDAHHDFVQILEKYIDNLPGAVAHCFTGSENEMMAYLDMGLSIGITGWVCDERRGQELKSIVNKIPFDRLMIETDAPYLLPRDLKPKPKNNRNEPAYLPHICQTVADCYGVEFDVIASHSSDNAMKLFNLK